MLFISSISSILGPVLSGELPTFPWRWFPSGCCPPSGSSLPSSKERWYPGITRGEIFPYVSISYRLSPIVWGCRFYSPLACYPYRGIWLPRWWFVPLTGSELPPVATLPGVRLKSFRFRLLTHSSPSVPVLALVPGSPSVKI